MKRTKMRILGLLLCTLTILCVSINVFAKDSNTVFSTTQIGTTIDRLNPDDYIEANEELVARGRECLNRRTSRTLNVVHYYQDGGQVWSNDIMQYEGLFIKSSGCCLTSFAMIQRYLGGMYNPRGVNSQMGSAACPFEFTIAASRFGFNISNYSRADMENGDAKAFIIGAIDTGYPVLVGMQRRSGSGTHYVVAYGYSGNNISIHDPASNRDYTDLDTYLSDYFVNRLYVYTR